MQIPAAFCSVQVFLLCVLLVFWAGAEGTGDASKSTEKANPMAMLPGKVIKSFPRSPLQLLGLLLKALLFAQDDAEIPSSCCVHG